MDVEGYFRYIEFFFVQLKFFRKCFWWFFCKKFQKLPFNEACFFKHYYFHNQFIISDHSHQWSRLWSKWEEKTRWGITENHRTFKCFSKKTGEQWVSIKFTKDLLELILFIFNLWTGQSTKLREYYLNWYEDILEFCGVVIYLLSWKLWNENASTSFKRDFNQFCLIHS